MYTLLKFKFKNFLSSVGAISLARTIKDKIINRNVDKRRFWKGGILLSPRANVSLFQNLKKQPFTLTYNKESRDCIYIDPNESITINTKLSGKAQIRLGFAHEGESNLEQGVIVNVNNVKKADLKYIVPNKWHHVAFTVDKGETNLNICNTCSSKIAVAHPLVEYEEMAGGRTTPKNIIVLILDSLTRESIGIFNPDVKKYTPNICRFFENSLKYTNCFTQSEWTFPSVFSLLLSRYSLDHGLSDLKSDFDEIPLVCDDTLAVHIKKLGYTTFAYSTVKVFHPAFNAHIGFDSFFYDPFPQPVQTHREICFQAVTQLQQNSKGKNFIFIHFFDTHEPWRNLNEIEESMLDNSRITDPEMEYKHYRKGQGDTKIESSFDDTGIKVLTQRRNARLFNVDLSLQVLFDYLEKTGRVKDTAVVFCSDHGYSFLGKNQPLLCDTRVGIPLLIRHPYSEGGMRKDFVEFNVDLGPTLVKIAGGNFTDAKGYPMPPLGKTERKFVLSESIFGNSYKVAIRTEDYVYHFSCKYNKNERIVCDKEVQFEALFERKIESQCLDVAGQNADEIIKMRGILKQHLHKYSRQHDKTL